MHPTSRQLIEVALAEGHGPGIADSAREHLAAGCPACEARIAGYRELLETMRTDRTPEPPAAWIARAVALRRPAPWAERVREWCGDRVESLGRLVYDSFASPDLAAAGARSVETERRLRLESAGVELDVRLEPVGHGGRVTGQVLRIGGSAAPLAGAAFLVTAGNAEVADGTTDDFGEFTVEIADLDRLRLRFVVDDGIAAFHLPGAGSAGD